MKLGTLYLIPVTLGDDNITRVLPPEVVGIAQRLETFVVENEKTARHFLSTIKTNKPVRELQLLTLNEHSTDKELPALLLPLLAGIDVGLMSEAGCPGIADPGAKLAELAHRKGIRVMPLVGPSSILLSLMASGFNGQQFTFLGYIPADKAARIQRLKDIEKISNKHHETQIFIETPYRNQHLLEDILAHCHHATRLCVACNITLEDELIVSKTIAEWKKSSLPDLHKKPTVFLLLA
ncbi:MAG TPA: SAM-dependent methyltransferase [Methylotenera sp.]|nr:SAM-dependent methyltransferase [Methylotenera sp.]